MTEREEVIPFPAALVLCVGLWDMAQEFVRQPRYVAGIPVHQAQPRVGASLSAISSAASPIAMKASDSTSSRRASPSSTGSFGTQIAATIAELVPDAT